MRHLETFQDPTKLRRQFSRNLTIAAVVVLLLSFMLLARLFSLQVLDHHHYQTLSRHNRINLIPIAPKRGLIYDKNGVLLAENTPVFNLNVIPSQVNNLAHTLTTIKNIIPLSHDEIKAFYRELHSKKPYEAVPIKTQLNQQQIAKIVVNRYRLPGVNVSASLTRYYHFASDMVSVLGYVGRINGQDLQSHDSSQYAATSYIGKVGLEKYYEAKLHGNVGWQQIVINASGEKIRTLSKQSPVSGDNLFLTIDSQLQESVIKAMHGHRGAVVAIEPATGRVLAMVSTPSYNPNLFVNGISTKAYQALQRSKDQPLFNRAIRGQFPFGSTIKVFLASAALGDHVIKANDQIYDPGYYTIGGHVFHDEAKDIWVNMVKAIEVSSDVFFYRLSLKMGITAMDDILNRFGFGQNTDIQMNEELPGLIASPAWKMKTKGIPWYAGDTLNSSIGQGAMLTTPLQLASATATLAEHGKRMQPTLVEKIIASDGTITPIKPKLLETIQYPESVWDTVIKGMQLVIRGKDGTGWRFGKPAYSVAAKTGTAQVYSLRGEKYILANVPKRLRDNSMFIAFAPVDHPKIAIAVAVQNSPLAPKIARQVLDDYLLKQHKLNPNGI